MYNSPTYDGNTAKTNPIRYQAETSGSRSRINYNIKLMGLFENIAVIDLNIRLAILPGSVLFAACTFVGAAIIGDVQAFRWSVIIGACLWILSGIAIYRRLPS